MAGLNRVIFALIALALPVQGSFYDKPEVVLADPEQVIADELSAKWDIDLGFNGISTFANLDHTKCLLHPEAQFDIAILGVPFDTATSFRPGARFGPRAVRAASARQRKFRAVNHRAGINPYTSWASILDCGDIPVTPYDNALALHQMTTAYTELLAHRPAAPRPGSHAHPKIISIGGDHSIALPALRALHAIHGEPITVLHFDAHLDTWDPTKSSSYWAHSPTQADFTHGSMFWLARSEGLIANSSSVHAGLRTRLTGTDYSDYNDDLNQGFYRIEADDIDAIGLGGIIDNIMGHIGTERPVYLSVDIDVLDPGVAPGTGTPEAGGWTMRELIQILRGIEELNVVGADLVEVAPAYDGVGEVTALSGAQIVYEIVTSLVVRGLWVRGGFDRAVKPVGMGRSATPSDGIVGEMEGSEWRKTEL